MTLREKFEKLEKWLSNYDVVYFILIVSILTTYFYIAVPIYEGELIEFEKFKILTFLFILGLSILYYRGHKLMFLIMCILLVTFGYFYTYQMQYDFPQYGYSIESGLDLDESKFTFEYFDQFLLYRNKTANLTQELRISNNQPIETYISFDLPKNTVYYEISIITNIDDKILLSINGTYNQNDKLMYKLKFPPRTHTIKMNYVIKDVEPIGKVRFWIGGSPKIEYILASVVFSKLKYQCSDPCITIPNVSGYSSGYYTPYDKAISYQNVNRQIIAYTFNIHLKNSEGGIIYFIWTSYKNPIILRNLLFALLIGLFVQAFGILLEKREEYIQTIKRLIFRQ